MQMNIQSDRLQLRVLHPNEADKVLSFYVQNKDHFEPWEPERDINFYTLSYQRLSLSIEYNLMQQLKLLRYWIFLKNDPHTIIGSVNFYNIVKGSYFTCQLGYKFDHRFLSQGYATEGIRAAMKVLFSDYEIHRIEANIMPSNLRSIHLAQKLGFQYEGLAVSSIKINHRWEDHARYAYINNEIR
ncbi:GNAT family N-acetyltransferase [Anaerocolumna jejuensis]|uniref:GNAT family N-acetyltransferase n=1 Tax=Anaerocolumna jejuensis TaxID=259063 RepID=UPI003F7B5B4A